MSDKVNQKVRTAVRKVPLSRFETPLNIERPSLQHGNVSSGEDDFVAVGQQDVEQTNVEKGKKRAGMKSKATRSPRRKHVNVEKGKKMNYLTTRCAPSLVVGLRNSLHHGIEESVRNIGFGHILEFKLDGIDDRALVFFLMNHIRDEPLSIVVGSKVLPINVAAVHAVLGIPIGGVKIYYLDNLECDDMIADFVSIPRARFFTSAIIEKIASADRESHDGYLSYGKLPLRERIGSCYANIGDGPGGQGHVLESVTSSAGFLYGKAAGVVKIHPAAKAKRDHIVKEKGVKHHDKHRSPPADDNTKRSKSKGQSASKTMEYRHIPYGFLHLQPLLRGLVDHISDGQQKMVFISALELHDNDVDEAIIKINEAHKDIEEAQQKFASEIKHMFGDLVGHLLNTESPRDIRRKRRAERPLGGSSLNVKRKSQIPRDVSPVHIDSGDDCPEIVVERSPQPSAGHIDSGDDCPEIVVERSPQPSAGHIDSGDDCPEIVVERSPQSSAGQSSFEQQEVAHAPSDTHVQHEVEQTVTVESVHEEVIHAELPTDVQHEGTELGVDARAQQEILTPATDTPVQHETTQPEATTVEHVEVELPAADTTDEVIRESDTCVQRSGVFDGDFNYEDWNEVGNILRELNEDPTQVSLRKEYDIKEAAALTGEKEKAKKIISARKLKSNTKKATRANKRKITQARRMKEVKSVEKKLRNLFLYPKDLGVDATFVSSSLDVQMIIPSPFKPPYVPRQPPDTTLVVALKTLIFTNDSFEMRTLIKYRENLPLGTFSSLLIVSSKKDLINSFREGKECECCFIDLFGKCIIDDDKEIRRRCAGYRVILPTFISQIILFENYTSESQYYENTVPSLLDERLKAHDLLNASLVFLPVHSRGHWTVYCVNMIHHQIDILDSYPCSWGFPYIDVPKQVLVNDCGFFVMLFLEHYDGERRKFDVPIIPEKGTQYRAELMYYLFFHKMNEARGPSLELFELLAPGKTEHNVIEGTQQIIDSSDATKVGVASRDVEKDDVASRDD
ncbi:hypothetical protein GUJ93_ZPchr0012g18949 [Zizania palustris]|uniref:Ubiquitin-like protease family profile domain-containing protein n=1 Tax=Zizania palustris TaxID=103762 RepID=A0A8J6BSL6_ZIZPA|nr:hypothetical protein GUJ93_ZPchr0012g18949 [Zizania palustris]